MAIYERKEKGGALIQYEVIKIREKKAQTINGYSYPDMEVYPAASQWGVYGWTLLTRERAEEKFKEVSNG